MPDITTILEAAEQGDSQAAADLLPLVYTELRRLAAQKLAQESPDHTLQATALVHEAYLRLVGAPKESRWQGRGHFVAAAAEAMRRILIESARRKKRQRHGGGHARIEVDLNLLGAQPKAEDLLDLDAALSELAGRDELAAQIAQLRCFAGLSVEEAASALEIPVRSAYRDWAFARAWLYRRLRGSTTEG